MASHLHRSILRQLAIIDITPDDDVDFSKWLTARRHLDLVTDNSTDDDLIIYASSRNLLIHGVIVNHNALEALTTDDLLEWSGNPFVSRAGYAWESESNDVWISKHRSLWPSLAREHIQRLVFARSFEGLSGEEAISYEILQEYIHAAGLFWRAEQSAYCCFDENGDFDPIVSVTGKSNSDDITLITFRRRQLEHYLAASDSVLVQMFEFILHRPGEFDGWSDRKEIAICDGDDFVYRQEIDDREASYTLGVQTVGLSRDKSEIFESIRSGAVAEEENSEVAFIALDWRNKRITDISTHPSATTNYFQASQNSLPYEVSPAFFRPEVLNKYKADQDKYTVSEVSRTITCRGAWDLRTYDINEEGQISTYIRYLRSLPYSEQLYWRSFNEPPKAWISERAFKRDFEGEWSDVVSPLEKVLKIARLWADSGVAWWLLREDSLLEIVSTPRTTSRNEWGRAFSDLAKLIIEGLRVDYIRTRLGESGVAFEMDEKSLKLSERFLVAHDVLADDEGLFNLRTVQHIRTKVDAHYGGRDARKLAADALLEHETYTAHFESICEGVAQELEMIEKAFA